MVDFAFEVARKIEELSLEIIQRTTTQIPGKRGFLGLNSTPDTVEEHVSVRHDLISRKIDEINRQYPSGTIYNRVDASSVQALKHFRKYPTASVTT